MPLGFGANRVLYLLLHSFCYQRMFPGMNIDGSNIFNLSPQATHLAAANIA